MQIYLYNGIKGDAAQTFKTWEMLIYTHHFLKIWKICVCKLFFVEILNISNYLQDILVVFTSKIYIICHRIISLSHHFFESCNLKTIFIIYILKISNSTGHSRCPYVKGFKTKEYLI